VVLPHPDGPRSVKNSLSRIVSETPCKAEKVPYRLTTRRMSMASVIVFDYTPASSSLRLGSWSLGGIYYWSGIALQPAETTELGIAAAVRELRQPGFTAALAALLQTVGSPDNLVFLVYRSSGTPEVLFSQTNDPTVFAEMERTYLPGAYRLDPYFDLHLTNAVSGAYRLTDIAPDAFHRSRYFSEYYEQTTLIDEIAFVINLAPDVTLNLCLGRDTTSARRFSSEDLEACSRLAPVVSALAERQWGDMATAASRRSQFSYFGAIRPSLLACGWGFRHRQ
jgi:hypothetical protein